MRNYIFMDYKNTRNLLILIILLSQAGCNTVHKIDPQLLDKKIAMIKNQDGFFSMRTVKLKKIDGEDPDFGRGFFDTFSSGMTSGDSYAVSAGQHLLEIEIHLMSLEPSLPNFVWPTPCKRVFELEAGHVYQITGSWSVNAYKINLFDETANKELTCINYKRVLR